MHSNHVGICPCRSTAQAHTHRAQRRRLVRKSPGQSGGTGSPTGSSGSSSTCVIFLAAIKHQAASAAASTAAGGLGFACLCLSAPHAEEDSAHAVNQQHFWQHMVVSQLSAVAPCNVSPMITHAREAHLQVKWLLAGFSNTALARAQAAEILSRLWGLRGEQLQG